MGRLSQGRATDSLKIHYTDKATGGQGEELENQNIRDRRQGGRRKTKTVF